MPPGADDDDRWWNFLVWKVAIPALAVFAIILLVPDIPHAITAARDEGTPGTFTSTRTECHGRGGCSFYGTFVSDDGKVEMSDALIDDGVEIVGEKVPAQYVEGLRVDKVYERHSRDWISLGLLLAAALAYLTWWGMWVVRPWLRRRLA